MSVKVNYKGEEILSVNTDTTKTLKTSGKYCEDDIEVVNTQDGGITPSGSIEITENGTYDVEEYAEAVVDVSGGGSGITRQLIGTIAGNIIVANNSYPDIAAIDLPDGVEFNAIMVCPQDKPTWGKLIPYRTDKTIALTNTGVFFREGNTGDIGSTPVASNALAGTMAFSINSRESIDDRTLVISFYKWAGGFGSWLRNTPLNVYGCVIDYGGAV